MLMAAVGITFVAVFTVEFATNTNVDWAAATNARDDMRAHFMARSGMNISELIIKVQADFIDGNDFMGGVQIAEFIPLFIGAFGGSAEEVEDFGKLLGASGDDLKGLGTEIGTFDVEITTDDGKINVNCARSDSTKKLLKSLLDALLYFEIYNPVFENPDAEGWRRDRAQQAAAIIDYIDKDRSRYDARGTAEDYGYQSLNDRYKVKNEIIDTVGELKLVRGVDDRFWTLFGSNFTVYGDCKVNLAVVEDPKTFAALIFLTPKDKNDPVVNNPAKLWALAVRAAQAREWGIQFSDSKQFIDFVKDPNAQLATEFAASGVQPGLNTPDPSTQVPVEGVDLDSNLLNQIATAQTKRRTYRVKARAEIDTLVKTIEGVWDTQTQNQNPRSPEYRRGSWVFWREE